MCPSSCHIDVGCLAAEHRAAQLPLWRCRRGYPAKRKRRSSSQTLLLRRLHFRLLLWLLLLGRQGRWPQVAASTELLSHCGCCRGQQRRQTTAARLRLFLLLMPVQLMPVQWQCIKR